MTTSGAISGRRNPEESMENDLSSLDPSLPKEPDVDEIEHKSALISKWATNENDEDDQTVILDQSDLNELERREKNGSLTMEFFIGTNDDKCVPNSFLSRIIARHRKTQNDYYYSVRSYACVAKILQSFERYYEEFAKGKGDTEPWSAFISRCCEGYLWDVCSVGEIVRKYPRFMNLNVSFDKLQRNIPAVMEYLEEPANKGEADYWGMKTVVSPYRSDQDNGKRIDSPVYFGKRRYKKFSTVSSSWIFLCGLLLFLTEICIVDAQTTWPSAEGLQKLTAIDSEADDLFGYSVSLSNDGSTALIGAHGEDEKGVYAGAAYIFKYNSTSGNYEQLQKLMASDGETEEVFGWSVSLSNDGSTALIGAYLEDEKGDNTGAAYIFQYNSTSGQYEQLQKLTAIDAEAHDWFGYSVSLSNDGSTALIGAHKEDEKGDNAGAAYIFKYNSTSGQYEQLQKLIASDGAASDELGNSVSLSNDGSTALIGARKEDEKGSWAGAAYIFQYNSTSGQYEQLQKLIAIDSEADDLFGYSVSLSNDGSTALIGAHKEDEKGDNAGAAYIFKYNSTSGQYEQLQKLIASDGAASDELGNSVSLSNDGSTALIGARGEDEKGNNAGAAYIGKMVCPQYYIFIPGTFDTCTLEKPAIISVDPLFGPVLGQTSISITGFAFNFFSDTSDLTVRFLSSSYNTSVSGVYKTSELVECISPTWPILEGETVIVEIGCKGENYTSDGKTFTYIPDWTISSFSPLTGPTDGGTIITIEGTNFDRSGSARCRFGDITVAASSITSTSVQCTSPASSTGVVNLGLSLNEQQYANASSQFRYNDITLQSVQPSYGPQSGGTVVNIQGKGMTYLGDPIKVKVMSEDIPSAVVHGAWNEGTVNFTMPDLTTSVGIPHTVQVHLSFNGQLDQFTSSSTSFILYEIQPEIRVTGRTPVSGPADGATNVTLSGSNYQNTGIIKVKIEVSGGSISIVDGEHIDGSTIKCTVPSQAEAGTASLSVALNGQQYTTDTQSFSYYQVTSVSPSIGPVGGSTTVTVHGTGFASDSTVMCQFGSLTPMTAISFTSSKVLCLSPASTAGIIDVEVSCNGLTAFTSSSTASFTYFDIPSITSVSPNSTYEYGGIVSTISGGTFLSSSHMTVVFLDPQGSLLPIIVPNSNVSFVSSSEIAFTVPSVETKGLTFPKEFYVEVRTDGSEASESSSHVKFRFDSSGDRSVSAISPDKGPKSGATVITLTGTHMGAPTDLVMCRFNNGSLIYSVSGVVVSDEQVQCTSPNITSVSGSISMAIELSRKYDNASFVPASQSFTFYPDFVVDRVDPAMTEPRAMIPIIVFGANFLQTDSLKCRFGNESDTYVATSTATFINSTAVECTASSHPANGQNSAWVYVYVSGNGQNWHSSTSIGGCLEYKPCSAGYYFTGYTNPCYPCDAGRYSVLPGEAACLECPERFYCPAVSSSAIECPSNTISLKGSSSKDNCQCVTDYYEPQLRTGYPCFECSQGAVCLGGTQRPYPKSGWWNSRESGDFVFFQCPAGTVSCVGGANATSECNLGYEKRMCSQCSTGFYKLEDLCLKCPENSVSSIVLGIIAFLFLVFVLKRFGGIQQSGGALSISVSYIQITSLFADFRLNWAQEILDFLSKLSLFTFNFDIVSPECSIENWTYSSRFFFTMSTPLIALGTVLLWHLLSVLHYTIVHKLGIAKIVEERAQSLRMPVESWASAWKRRLQRTWRAIGDFLTTAEDPASSFRGAINAFLMMLSLLYIILATKALEIFDCTSMTNGYYSLDSYPEMLCWVPGGEHMQLIPWGIVFSIIYIAGIPLLFLLILLLNRRSIRDTSDFKFKRACGALFKRFNARFFWWEVVILSRKLIMILIRLNLTNYPLVQGAVGEVVILLALSIHSYAHPYVKKSLNRLESSLLFCNFLVLLAGMMFHDDKFQTDTIREMTKLLTTVLIILSLVGICVFVMIEMVVTVKVSRAKRIANSVLANSPTWNFWAEQLPPSDIPSFLSWVRNASAKEIDTLEEVTKELREGQVSKRDRDIAQSLSDLSSKGTGTFVNIISTATRLLKRDRPETGVKVLEFFHAIKSNEKKKQETWSGKEEIEMNSLFTEQLTEKQNNTSVVSEKSNTGLHMDELSGIALFESETIAEFTPFTTNPVKQSQRAESSRVQNSTRSKPLPPLPPKRVLPPPPPPL